MESDVSKTVKIGSTAYAVKVHSSMCSELARMLEKAMAIIPALEAARPGSSVGIKELCSMNMSVSRGKQIIQSCCESSKLYLALTGSAVMLRCQQCRDVICGSLAQLRNLVPPALGFQVDSLLGQLRKVQFVLDTVEAEAGEAIMGLLNQMGSSLTAESEAFQLAATKLHLTTPKAVLVERRSIKAQLDRLDPHKEKNRHTLNCFLHLLGTHGHHVRFDHSSAIAEHAVPSDGPTPASDSKVSTSTEDTSSSSSHLEMKPAPPNEFLCPISSQLMNDPVTISSGQTFERTSLEKWFADGNVSCPVLHKRLDSFQMVPNTILRNLIARWREQNGVDVGQAVPAQAAPSAADIHSLNSSIASLNHISSTILRFKFGDYVIERPHDTSTSFTSSDAPSDTSRIGAALPFPWSADYQACESFEPFNRAMFLKFLRELSELPLEVQGRAVDDFKDVVKADGGMLSSEFLDASVEFLKSSFDLPDNGRASRAGARLLCAFLSSCRAKLPLIDVELLRFLASLIESEVTVMEALMMFGILTRSSSYRDSIVACGAAASLVRQLEISDHTATSELAVKILARISDHNSVRALVLSSSECVSKLAQMLHDERQVTACLEILRSMSSSEDGVRLIASNSECISGIVEVLETSCHADQDHATQVLLSLCSGSSENCKLVLNEGVIPALVDVSVNGSDVGRETSKKVLQLLRDLQRCEATVGSNVGPKVDATSTHHLPDTSNVSGQPPAQKRRGGFFSKFRARVQRSDLTITS